MTQTEAIKRFTQLMSLRNLAPKTKRAYMRAINQFFDFIKVDDCSQITLSMAQDFLVHLLEKGYAPRTHNIYVYALRNFYNYVLTIPADKALPKMKAPVKEKAVFTGEQAKTLVYECRNTTLQAAIALSFGCGLRASEVVNLKIGDIDKEHHLLIIRNSKGNKTRSVPYEESLVGILNDYCVKKNISRRNPDAYLFPSTKKPGHHLQSSTLTSLFKEWIQDFPFTLPGHTFHSLRHAFATELANGNTPLPRIQRYMGHRSAATTAVYIHMTDEMYCEIPDVLKKETRNGTADD